MNTYARDSRDVVFRIFMKLACALLLRSPEWNNVVPEEGL